MKPWWSAAFRLLRVSLTVSLTLALAGAAPLELVVLGSGGPGATGRAGSCYLVLVNGAARILVDAGPGSFARLGESGFSLEDVDLVLLTHLHVDHVGELPGLFKARAVSSSRPIRFRVFGPRGRAGVDGEAGFPATSRLMELLFGRNGAFAYLADFSSPMTYTATDLPRSDAEPPAIETILDEGGLRIQAIAGHHRDAPALIYRIDYGGKSLTFSGDLDPAGWPALRRIAVDTSLLIFHCVVLDRPGSAEALYELHTPPRAIGKLAAASRTPRLLLGHLSPATDRGRSAVRGSIARTYLGSVEFARDGLRIEP